MTVRKITASLEFGDPDFEDNWKPANREEAIQSLLESLADDCCDIEVEED